MSWNLLVNILFAGLVIAGIYYAWRLQRTLKNLSQDRVGVEKAVGDFSAAIARAERAITELHSTSRDLSQEVDRQVVRAQSLRDELSFLTDTADKIAGRLAEASAQAQSSAKQPKPALRPVAEEKPPAPEPAAPPPAPDSSAIPAWARRAGNDAVVINKPSASLPKAEAAKEAVPEEPRKKERAEKKELPRSQAERELMQALDKIR